MNFLSIQGTATCTRGNVGQIVFKKELVPFPGFFPYETVIIRICESNIKPAEKGGFFFSAEESCPARWEQLQPGISLPLRGASGCSMSDFR